MAVDLLNDPVIIETIILAGADVNCVNNDNVMPLGTVMNKRVKNMDNEDLEDIEFLLQQKGAKSNWRKF